MMASMVMSSKLDKPSNSQNTVVALHTPSLYGQSVARLEQNLNLTGRINELTEENSLLLRQELINSVLPVSLEVTGRALAVSWCRLSSGTTPTRSRPTMGSV